VKVSQLSFTDEYDVPAAKGLGPVEIRWHGRGGQGVVTAGEILAETALKEGRYFQAFPEFGAERTGAPIRAYTRLSDDPIYLHCPVLEPAVVVVLDSTLLSAVKVFDGLRDGGFAVINSSLSPEAVAPPGERQGWAVATVDATRIALDTLKRPIPNTSMIGALLRVNPVVDKDACAVVIESRLSARFPARIVDANLEAFWQAHSSVSW
jgi:2-oxoacid:acceptor oxidoreductase gamma subunit (pyruvate/2-ketoisovalerate family)|tara:strand:- start:15619 stop:16242 length:624 start_codon:yes stop_codon:yes gene_type:complete